MSFQGVVERFFDARFINPVCSGALEIIAARKTAYQFVILEDIPVGEDITDEFEPAVWPLKICCHEMDQEETDTNNTIN